MKFYMFILVLLMCILSHELSAKTDNIDSSDDELSWQLTGGIAGFYNPSILKDDLEPEHLAKILNISLLVDLYYKGFFIQTDHRRVEGMAASHEIGYQLVNKNKWGLDLLYKSYIYGFDPELIAEYADVKNNILEGMTTRHDANGVGLRYSRFFDDAVLSMDVASIVSFSAGDDWVAEAFYSHLIPYKNWDLHLGVGLSYYTKDTVDYYLGIRPHEVNARRPEYEAEAGYRSEVEFLAQRPINENWMLNVGINHTHYDSSIRKSPIVKRNNVTVFTVGVLYAF